MSAKSLARGSLHLPVRRSCVGSCKQGFAEPLAPTERPRGGLQGPRDIERAAEPPHPLHRASGAWFSGDDVGEEGPGAAAC